jgi:hypothetical protein
MLSLWQDRVEHRTLYYKLKKEENMSGFRWSHGAAILAFLAWGAAAAADARGTNSPLVEHVRNANDRFKDVSVAKAEGYAPIPCASGLQGGAMGIHYVSEAYLKDNITDIKHPEAVMYEPSADGKLTLVAVEYIAFKGPAALEGHLFNFVSEPNRYGLDKFYELHVWAWKQNPAGNFADNNPHVSCDAMKVEAK